MQRSYFLWFLVLREILLLKIYAANINPTLWELMYKVPVFHGK
ncbi:hypothetical protein NC99_44720 [Sunxiuqinia dokdonensis]|uniref:Uncharacterized protein n=1 Tax=Sunxiuqinia dokdonensis TaxID=1409788 RepID=A0A0L8V2T9_9BACT|nr:hypothetical protein NC99_44720 [Sunxiuqinia dokdonensis]